MNMSVHTLGATRPRRGTRPPLLDVAAEVLVADPAASLAEVAEAAGIGRTTLHKHYATRDDLLRAVGHRAIDRWEAALDQVAALEAAALETGALAAGGLAAEDGPPGVGLAAIITAMVPIGSQLGFLWRTPALGRDRDLGDRLAVTEQRTLAVLRRAQDQGVLAAGTPDWWLLDTFYSLIYMAAESVADGKLAPNDAPGLVTDTLLRGIGARLIPTPLEGP
jgi:AcrR family transcriptional regulator